MLGADTGAAAESGAAGPLYGVGADTLGGRDGIWGGCDMRPGAGVGMAAGDTYIGASSAIFVVGATRESCGVNRAPQPPQNRESGVFSVPQLGQRIPPTG